MLDILLYILFKSWYYFTEPLKLNSMQRENFNDDQFEQDLKIHNLENDPILRHVHDTFFFSDTHLPVITALSTGEYLKKLMDSKQFRYGYKFVLSDFFEYGQCTMSLPDLTNRTLHNKKWQHVNDRFTLKRNCIRLKQNAKKLNVEILDVFILGLAEFLTENGRTVRELVLNIPPHENQISKKEFSTYRIYFQKPTFIPYTFSEDGMPHFFITGLTVEDLRAIHRYNQNEEPQFDGLQPGYSLDVYFPFFWFSQFILNA